MTARQAFHLRVIVLNIKRLIFQSAIKTILHSFTFGASFFNFNCVFFTVLQDKDFFRTDCNCVWRLVQNIQCIILTFILQFASFSFAC